MEFFLATFGHLGRVRFTVQNSLCPQWLFARKTVFPTKKLKGASQKGKVSDFTNS